MLNIPKTTGLFVLEQINALFQQNLISNDEKNSLSNDVKSAMKTGSYNDLFVKANELYERTESVPAKKILDAISQY